jgi:hypothetical protein
VHLYLCLTQGALISMSQQHWLKHVMLFWCVRVHDLVVNSLSGLCLLLLVVHMLCCVTCCARVLQICCPAWLSSVLPQTTYDAYEQAS